MERVLFYAQLFMLFLSPWSVSAQSCETWVPVDELSYNMTYTDINDVNANTYRPLGFKKSSYIFEGDEPCVVVESTAGNGRHIQVSVELGDQGTLDIKSDQGLKREFVNQVALCNTLPGADSVKYTFYCEGSGCESGEKLFWYRFVVEEPDENGQYDENWCDTRNSNFPSSLISIPSVVAPPPPGDDKEGGASGLSCSFQLLLFTFFALLISL